MNKLVFNAKKWNGKDKGNNSQFYEECEIVETKGNAATVKWPDGSISHGHFLDAMKDVLIEKLPMR